MIIYVYKLTIQGESTYLISRNPDIELEEISPPIEVENESDIARMLAYFENTKLH